MPIASALARNIAIALQWLRQKQEQNQEVGLLYFSSVLAFTFASNFSAQRIISTVL